MTISPELNKDVENRTKSLCPVIRIEVDTETKITPDHQKIEDHRIQPNNEKI